MSRGITSLWMGDTASGSRGAFTACSNFPIDALLLRFPGASNTSKPNERKEKMKSRPLGPGGSEDSGAS